MCKIGTSHYFVPWAWRYFVFWCSQSCLPQMHHHKKFWWNNCRKQPQNGTSEDYELTAQRSKGTCENSYTCSRENLTRLRGVVRIVGLRSKSAWIRILFWSKEFTVGADETTQHLSRRSSCQKERFLAISVACGKLGTIGYNVVMKRRIKYCLIKSFRGYWTVGISFSVYIVIHSRIVIFEFA